jgi:hypothetical protein
MESKNEHLESLKEIRSIMEKSSQFLSLSGLSGVFIGLAALLGALIIYLFQYDFFFGRYSSGGVFLSEQLISGKEYIDFLVLSSITGIIVLILAITFGIIFTAQNARKKGLPLWSSSAKRMLINLFIPLIAGGLFCIALLFHRLIYLVAPATLIFYGLALGKCREIYHKRNQVSGNNRNCSWYSCLFCCRIWINFLVAWVWNSAHSLWFNNVLEI